MWEFHSCINIQGAIVKTVSVNVQSVERWKYGFSERTFFIKPRTIDTFFQCLLRNELYIFRILVLRKELYSKIVMFILVAFNVEQEVLVRVECGHIKWESYMYTCLRPQGQIWGSHCVCNTCTCMYTFLIFKQNVHKIQPYRREVCTFLICTRVKVQGHMGILVRC